MRYGQAEENVRELLRKTKDGEDEAFSEIVEQYRPLIESSLYHYVDRFDYDELEQEALIALYRAACSYDPKVNNVSFGLYAKICISNSLISFVRYSKKNESVYADPIEKADGDVAVCDPSVDYINRESFLLLDRYVKDSLSEYEYSVFRLYIEGYRYKEMACILNKTEKSVEGAVLRMKNKLKNSLNNYDL